MEKPNQENQGQASIEAAHHDPNSFLYLTEAAARPPSSRDGEGDPFSPLQGGRISRRIRLPNRLHRPLLAPRLLSQAPPSPA